MPIWTYLSRHAGAIELHQARETCLSYLAAGGGEMFSRQRKSFCRFAPR